MKVERMVLALAMGAAATGCATVTRGTSQDFTVETTPVGAAVSTSNGFECAASPCTFRMQRKHGFTVSASLAGYHTAEATVTSSMSGAGGAGMAGNVLIGGIIGIGVDAASGATNDLRPNPLHLVLEPIAAPAAEAATVSLTTDDAAAAAAAAVAVDAVATPAEAAAPAPSN